MLVVSLIAFAMIHHVHVVPSEAHIYWDLLNENYDIFYTRMNHYLCAMNLPHLMYGAKKSSECDTPIF
jgi:hypothetical protein